MDNTYLPLVPTKAESIVISGRLKSISQIFDFERFAYFPKNKIAARFLKSKLIR